MSNLATSKNNINPSKNAVKHAVYSSDVVLRWENKAEFEALHQTLNGEYEPHGASEEAAVFDLASLHWKKRRLNIGSQLTFHKQPNVDKMADASSDGWEGVAKYLAKTDDGMADSIRAMAKAQADASKIICEIVLKHMKRATDSNGPRAEPKEDIEFERLSALAKEISFLGTELVRPMLHIVEKHVLDSAERAYRPDVMEKELKLHAEIDRQIEKTLKRLVMIKEYKNFYRPKSIDPKQSEVTSSPAAPIR
jgi:hypothetical protein